MDLSNLTVIGSSHIAKQSLDEVEKKLKEIKPDIVAVELDKGRLQSLFEENKEKIKLRHISQVGFKGFMFSIFGQWAEKKMGQLVGISPGSEMKKAVEIAKKEKMKIALIDQNIEVTLRKFSKALTWKEKGRFVGEIFGAIFGKRRELEFDLTKVPSEKIIMKLLDEVKEKYPNIYRVLIDERNVVMAHRLRNLMVKYPDKKIVAIVGAGHKKEILNILRNTEVTYSFTYSV